MCFLEYRYGPPREASGPFTSRRRSARPPVKYVDDPSTPTKKKKKKKNQDPPDGIFWYRTCKFLLIYSHYVTNLSWIKKQITLVFWGVILENNFFLRKCIYYVALFLLSFITQFQVIHALQKMYLLNF